MIYAFVMISFVLLTIVIRMLVHFILKKINDKNELGNSDSDIATYSSLIVLSILLILNIVIGWCK